MKTKGILNLLILSVLLAGMTGLAYAQGPDLVENSNVTPAPVVAGSTVYIYSELAYTTPSATVRLCVPRDWASQATLDGLTPSSAIGEGWGAGVTALNSPIGGVQTWCSDYSTSSASVGWDAVEWSFAVLSTATVGSNRPVRIWLVSGNVTNPPLQTLYVTVQGTPTTRYIADSDCAGNTPCDTGTGALASAVSALPASGGTIIVVGQHSSNGGVAIGAKDITLRPLNSSAELRGPAAGACAGDYLIQVNSTGDLTIDGLTLDGQNNTSCRYGVSAVGTGGVTIQNSAASIKNWNLVGASLSNSGTNQISNSTFSGNGASGLDLNTASVTVDSCTFSSNGHGIRIFGGTVTVEDSTISGNTSDGIEVSGGTATIRGNTISGSTGYGLDISASTVTAYANNFTGNNGSGYQANGVSAASEAAKNWWGSASDSSVGPNHAASWSARLGADVDSWAAGSGSATLGDAQLSGGTGTAVIVSFGRGSANAPFGNGVPPYVNQPCSTFYDFYVVPGGSGTWTVQLPIDNTSNCIANVLNYEVVFKINDNTECATANNTACWDRIPDTDILMSDSNLLISQSTADLGGTHYVAGDSSGAYDPTAITLSNVTARSPRQWLPVALVVAALVGVGGALVMLRRRRYS